MNFSIGEDFPAFASLQAKANIGKKKKREEAFNNHLTNLTCNLVQEVNIEEEIGDDNNYSLLANALQSNTSLTEFVASHTYWESIDGPKFCKTVLDSLVLHPKIGSISLNLCNLTDQGSKSMEDFLCTNKTVNTLMLINNCIGPSGGECISNGLKQNSTLTELNLKLNRELGSEGTAHIAGAIAVNNTLTHLDLQSTCAGDEGASAISDALLTNKSLISLNLHDCRLSTTCLEKLCLSVIYHPKLKKLFIHGNPIGDEGANIIAKHLNVMDLKVLTIGSCKITDQGFISLASALEENQTLECIGLADNPFGDVGLEAILKATVKSNHLQSLDVSKFFDKTPLTFPSKILSDFIGSNCNLSSFRISNSNSWFKNPPTPEFDLDRLALNTNLVSLGQFSGDKKRFDEIMDRNKIFSEFKAHHTRLYPLMNTMRSHLADLDVNFSD